MMLYASIYLSHGMSTYVGAYHPRIAKNEERVSRFTQFQICNWISLNNVKTEEVKAEDDKCELNP